MKEQEAYDIIYNKMKEINFLYDDSEKDPTLIDFKAYGGVESIEFYDGYLMTEAHISGGIKIHCDDITSIETAHEDYGEGCTLWLDIFFGKNGRNKISFEFERRDNYEY